jgi:hypothetical protein
MGSNKQHGTCPTCGGDAIIVPPEADGQTGYMYSPDMEARKEIERLRAALDKCCDESDPPRPQVGRSIDYANGFRTGVQCQRLRAFAARRKALEEE